MNMTNYIRRSFSTTQLISASKGLDPWGNPVHTPGGAKKWKFMSLFVCLPAVILLSVKVFSEHAAEKKCHKRPPFIPYDHMYIRRKKFPWGDGNHTLFHNPKANALPTGYEDEEEGEE